MMRVFKELVVAVVVLMVLMVDPLVDILDLPTVKVELNLLVVLVVHLHTRMVLLDLHKRVDKVEIVVLLVLLVVLVVLDGMVEVVVLDRLEPTQMVVEEVVEVHIFILALRVVQQHRLE